MRNRKHRRGNHHTMMSIINRKTEEDKKNSLINTDFEYAEEIVKENIMPDRDGKGPRNGSGPGTGRGQGGCKPIKGK